MLMLDNLDEIEIIKLMYKFRYFCLLPVNSEKNIKEVKELETILIPVEKKLVKLATDKKVISKVPFEVMRHVFETRIIKLEGLFYKITTENGKNYVQIFDENISGEKIEINIEEKTKINKKIRIFIY